MINSRKL